MKKYRSDETVLVGSFVHVVMFREGRAGLCENELYGTQHVLLFAACTLP